MIIICKNFLILLPYVFIPLQSEFDYHDFADGLKELDCTDKAISKMYKG